MKVGMCLRAERHKRAQELGFIGSGALLAPMPDDAREWDDLNIEMRALYGGADGSQCRYAGRYGSPYWSLCVLPEKQRSSMRIRFL